MKKVTEQQIKSAARKKFGSLTRFAKTAGVQALDLYSTFRMKDCEYKQQKLDKIMRQINTFPAIALSKDWKHGIGDAVRAAILDKHGTVTAFCAKHPQFKNYWISLILNDKKVRISNKVSEVLQILKIDLNKI